MQMNRCPKAMADSASTADLLRYCYYYMEYGSFPDGMISADPLLDALNVFVNYFRQFEQEEYDQN